MTQIVITCQADKTDHVHVGMNRLTDHKPTENEIKTCDMIFRRIVEAMQWPRSNKQREENPENEE